MTDQVQTGNSTAVRCVWPETDVTGSKLCGLPLQVQGCQVPAGGTEVPITAILDPHHCPGRCWHWSLEGLDSVSTVSPGFRGPHSSSYSTLHVCCTSIARMYINISTRPLWMGITHKTLTPGPMLIAIAHQQTSTLQGYSNKCCVIRLKLSQKND